MIPTGSPMFILFEKVKQCRMALVDWSRVIFGASSHQLKAKHQVLHELYTSNVANNYHEIQRVKDEINTILYQDEIHWRQRSRSIWLRANDKNTKFFHQRASQRKRKNHINGIFDSRGNWCEDENNIARVAEDYFQWLFSSAHPSHNERVLKAVDHMVTLKMNHHLSQPYTAKEVKRALFQMHPSKSLGSNDMSPFFFQKY